MAVAGLGAFVLLRGSSAPASSGTVVQSLPSGSLADLLGNFTSLDAEAISPFGTLIDQYAVVGHPTINGTSLIEINATVTHIPPPSSGGTTTTFPFIGWILLNGTADFIRSNGQVTNCLPPSEFFCQSSGPPFVPASDAYPGSPEWSGQFSNSTFLSHFTTVQETTSLGPTQFELTNYTLTSPVVNIGGIQWTSGCFEIGHAVGSNVNFLLAVRYYVDGQLFLGFEILSASKA